MNYICSVEGNIGVGKTTFLNWLQKKYDGLLRVFKEDCEDYLELVQRFYEDPHKNAFVFQSAMLTRKCTNMKQALSFPNLSITERIPSSNYEVFALNCYKSEYMDKVEWNCYRKHYNDFAYLYPPPHMIIYFNAEPEFLLPRIKERGRKGEEYITLEYLHNLQKLYKSWLRMIAINYTNVIEIRVDRDFSEEDFEKIFSQIRFSFGKFIERKAA